jgi:SAM-dependent methyltransferase
MKFRGIPLRVSNIPSSSAISPSAAQLVKDIMEWDVRNWMNCLQFWLKDLQGVDPASANVLTVGERNGGLSLWFALQGYSVICSDLTGPTLKARELHRHYGVANRITYANVDLFKIPFEDQAFDVVACKSVIGGLKLVYRDPKTRSLDNQSCAVAEIHRVLKPGGVFCGAENLKGTLCHSVLRNWAKKGRIGWRHMTPEELMQLFSPFERVEFQPYGFLGTSLILA